MVQKHFYEAPESELILVKFEGNFCTTETDDWTQGGAGYYNGDKQNAMGDY